MNRQGICKKIYQTYWRGASRRGLPFDLSLGEVNKFLLGDCFYCGVGPTNVQSDYDHKSCSIVRFIYNGIDRIDNHLGYTPENCVSCCYPCNKMKMNTTLEDFFVRISRIYRYHNLGQVAQED